MIKPDPYTDDCPLCGGRPVLLEKKWFEYVARNNVKYEGWDWFYKCQKCKETFTTTHSDTISFGHLKKTQL